MAVQAQQMYSDTNPHRRQQNHGFGFPFAGIGSAAATQDLFTDHRDNGNAGIGDGGRGGLVDGFCFNFQQQKQSPQPPPPPPPPPPSHMQYLQLQPDSVNQDATFFHPGNHHRSNVASQMMEAHKLEVDLFITLQYERLRWVLQDQRKQQLAAMIKSYESKAQFLLQQKDEEIAKGLNRMMELEQLLKGIEEENQTWEKVAKDNEAIITSMNKTMEQLQEGGGASQSGNGNAEDAESCCDVGTTENENGSKNMTCKICHSRNSCVILLPCRHLCSCNGCVAFIGSCPVCNVVKKASIEALF